MCEISDLLQEECNGNESGLLADAFLVLENELTTFNGVFSAAEFSASLAYAVDDLVKYEGEVYKCIAVHAAGAWNAIHFALEPQWDVRIQAAHVAAAGKGFVKVQIKDDDAQAMYEMAGERFNRSGKMKAEIFHPGSGKAAAQFFKRTNGRRVVLIVPRPGTSGDKIQIGLPGSPAELTYNFASGTRANGGAGMKATIEAFQTSVVFYDYAIPLKP